MDESLPERPALFFDFVLPPRSKELFANLWIADPHDTTPMIRPHVNGSRLGRLSELLMMHIVRIVKGRQNFCVTSRLFNMFVKKRSQLTHECNNFFIVPARECERTQFPYPIFKGGGHGPYCLGAGCHKALKRFSTGNNVGQRGSFPERRVQNEHESHRRRATKSANCVETATIRLDRRQSKLAFRPLPAERTGQSFLHRSYFTQKVPLFGRSPL